MKALANGAGGIMTTRKLTFLVGGALAAAVLAGVALSQGTSGDKDAPPFGPDLTYNWVKPTTGTPVVKYEVEIRKGGPGSMDIETATASSNQIVVTEVAWLTIYQVRTRGVDASNRVGPWSAWSEAIDRDNQAPSF
jgi:hypothetical protein